MPKYAEDLPQSSLAISEHTKGYHPDLMRKLIEMYPEHLVRLDYGEHGNGMPIYLVGASGMVLMINFLNGDNIRDALTDLAFSGNAFTTGYDAAGPNTSHLKLFFPFADLRGHDKTRKAVEDQPDQRMIVQAQGINDEVIAKTAKYVAGAEEVFIIDAHNPWQSSQHFNRAGIGFTNLTTNSLLIGYLHEQEYLNDRLTTVVLSTDIGDLLNSYDLAQRLQAPLIFNSKVRDGDNVKRRFASNLARDNRIIISDDSISGASTIETTIGHLVEEGAEEIIYYATFPIFVGDYYKKIKKVLQYPQVRIIVSDLLPFIRMGRTISIPYSDDPAKTVEVLSSSDWVVGIVGKILNAGSDEERKTLLKPDILETRNPYQVLNDELGITIDPPKDVGVYHGGGNVEYFKNQ